MTRPKRPDHTHRSNTAEVLRLVAELLTAPDASRVFNNIHLAAQVGYPARGSTVAATPANEVDPDGIPVQPSSPTERPTISPDEAAAAAQRLLSAYFQLGDLSLELLNGLRGWSPTRSVKTCTVCQHPLDKGAVRCRRVDPDTGVQCGASESAWPRCASCSEPMPPNERRGGRCRACWANASRPASVKQERGSDTIKATDLALGGYLTSEGTYIG